MFLIYGQQFFMGFRKGWTWIIGEGCCDGWQGRNFILNISCICPSVLLSVKGFFIFSSVSVSRHCSQGLLSGSTVDDNLASVYFFLFADNDHGTEAIEKLWKDEHSHTHRWKTVWQRESGLSLQPPQSAEGKPFRMKQNRQRGIVDLNTAL